MTDETRHKVMAQAADVFGGEDKALRWLETPALSLGLHKPLDMLRTSAGADAVRALLERINYTVCI
jgi:putative toxin-antitoxin system antitoxin component (TIGR02293 family)